MITAQKIAELEQRLKALGIQEKDLIEKFIHSQGKGGQNVNKVATCVYIKHLPSGIEVKCQKERSQAMNRFFARRLLAEKLEEAKGLGSYNKEIDKIRKQKARRAKKARVKVLEKVESAG